MATTLAAVPLAPHPNMPGPSHPHANENHAGRGASHEYGFVSNPVVLNTPSRSTELFPHRAHHDPTYLPTPQSAAPLAQQQQQHPFLQKHTEDYKYASPVPTPHWQPQPVAGPSTYRRSPNLVSPMSVNGSEHASRGLPTEHASPARGKPRGRMTAPGEQVMMDGMERMQVDEGDGRVGVEEPCECEVLKTGWCLPAVGERQYTELKCLGDGSFGTVWLCDWHSPVRSSTMLSAMQCGAGARPEWAGKRLVALKRMKRVWEGGWSQASKLGEIYVST
jgi:meiosis induction protein kinase IME2/SME1